MKGVLVCVHEYKDKASDAEKEIIQYVIDEPEKVSLMNSYQLAHITFTSPATVVRLCKKIGFSGYKDFQKSLIMELAVRKENDREWDKDLQREDSLEKIITKVTYKNMLSIEKTGKLIDEKVLSDCLDLLENCRNIAFFGLGSSLLVARDAYLKFLRLNKSCYISDEWHTQLLYAKSLTKNDIAIMISYSGITEEMLICADAVKKKGVPLITITRMVESKLTHMADYKLYVPSSEVLMRSGAMSSRISQLNVIDILYTAYINRHYDENKKQAHQTYIPKQIEDNEQEDLIDAKGTTRRFKYREDEFGFKGNGSDECG